MTRPSNRIRSDSLAGIFCITQMAAERRSAITVRAHPVRERDIRISTMHIKMYITRNAL
jgi:hypothetical protein